MKTLQQLYDENRDLLHPDLTQFDCGPGWLDIVEHALFRWRNEVTESRVFRVKQKLGTLRIQSDDPGDRVAKAIHDGALAASECSCKMCGRPGTLTASPSGGAATLCTACSEVHPK